MKYLPVACFSTNFVQDGAAGLPSVAELANLSLEMPATAIKSTNLDQLLLTACASLRSAHVLRT